MVRPAHIARLSLYAALSIGTIQLAHAATPVFAGYPAPGGTSAAGSGAGVSQAGGKTWTYSGFDSSAYGQLFYTIGSYSGSNYNLGSPILSADGSNSALGFVASQSNLGAGTALWSGKTWVPVTSGLQALWTEFRLTVTDTAGNALAMSDPGLYGLPSSAGATLLVTGNFKATWEFLASTDGVNYSAALPLYNGLSFKLPTDSLVSNVGGAFYATPAVPEPESIALAIVALGLFGLTRRSKQNG